MKIFRAKYLWLIIGLIGLGCLTIGVFKNWYPKNREINQAQRLKATSISRLVEIIGTNRLTEARPVGGFAYSPYNYEELLKQNYNPSTGKKDKPENLISKDNNSTDNVVLAEEVNRGELYSPPTFRPKIAEIIEFKTIAAEFLNADVETPSLETARCVALIYLFQAEFYKSLCRLEEQLVESPKNAELLNDLAVAYLAYASSSNQPRYLFRALSTIAEAIEANPSLIEAKFNQALILEKVHLLPSAKEYWQEYLKTDPSSPWADEARKHLEIATAPVRLSLWPAEKERLNQAIWQGNEKLAKEIISRFPHPARIYALEDLFPSWANACLEGHIDEAWRFLEIARIIGLTLVDVHNDHQIKDSLSAIVPSLEVSFLNNPDLLTLTDHQHKLATAHSLYKNGLELYRQYQLQKALLSLVKSQNIFAELNDSSSYLMTTFLLARCQMEQFGYIKALDLLNKILLNTENNNYPNLLGLCWYSLGTIQLYQLELSQAILSQKSALKYLKQIDDSENTAMANILMTDILERAGDKRKIWFYQYQALVSFSQLPKSTKQMNILLATSFSLGKLGETRSALCFINQQINVATQSNDHLFLSASFFYRSQINYQLNNTTEAFLDLDRAKQHLRLIPNLTYQKSTNQEIEIIESSYKLKTDPKIVIEKFNTLIKTNHNTLDRYNFTSIYYSRALAYISLGEYKKAEIDLEISIKEIERERKIIDNEEHKITFFQKPQKIYETMIELQAIFQKNAILAFNYTEDAHARALLDSFNTKPLPLNLLNSELNKNYKANSLPLKLTEVQTKLPKNTAIIEYKMLSNYLLIWVIKQNGIEFFSLPVAENTITKLVNSLKKSIENPKNTLETKTISTNIFDLIFRPIKALLPLETTLVFIPDKDLHFLPFSALIDSETNKYLIQQYPIAIAPSATIFTHCLERDKELAKKDNKSIFAIGNPSFNRGLFPSLPNLSLSAKEVEEITKLYKNSIFVTEQKATKKIFFENIKTSSIIHFAGHAIMELDAPLYSKLLMAPDTQDKKDKDDTGELYAYELYNYKFSYTRLVILAACHSANGQSIAGEGIASLARPFLSNGVPTVIGSLWNANDKASSKLFIAFHKNLLSGKNAIEALRLAQLSLIDDPNTKVNPPAMWAPFLVVGASTKN